MLIGLHGQHCLAHHGVVALGGQAGLLCAGVHHAVVRLIRRTNALGNNFGGLGVEIHTGVALRGTLHNLLGGDTQARGKLHDVNVAAQSASQQPVGGFTATGTQNLLAQLCEQPVARGLIGGTIGAGD